MSTSVTKTPNGRWRARVKSGQRGVASRTFDLKRDADVWADKLQRALDLGEYVDPKAGRVSLADALAEWLSDREGTVAGSTLSRDRDIVSRLPRALVSRPVGSLQASDFEAFYGDLLRRGQARGSVARARTTLSACVSWLVKRSVLASNPVRESRVPAGAQTTTAREVWPFTVEELRAVHADTRALVTDKAAADLILVLGHTGLRWGELAALRVRDVQRVPRLAFRVSRSRPDGQPVRSVTKGGKPRTVPLANEVAAIVAPLLDNRPPDAPLFPDSAGGMRLLSNWRRAVHWDRYRRGRRVHDLRHTAATLWLSSGIDLKTAQTWLGHSSAKLTADVYSHWLGSDADDAAIARYNAALGDAGGTRRPNLRRAK